MNGNGVVAAVENYGVNDHYLQSVAYFVQLTANGSWSYPTVIWSGNEQFTAGGLTYQPPLLIGLSGNNRVLGSMGNRVGVRHRDRRGALQHNVANANQYKYTLRVWVGRD
jgi:hypothetical protein